MISNIVHTYDGFTNMTVTWGGGYRNFWESSMSSLHTFKYLFLPFNRTTTTFRNKFDGSALAERASIETAADFEPTNVPLSSNWASLYEILYIVGNLNMLYTSSSTLFVRSSILNTVS